MDKEEHEGRITENILYFSRLLRAAGLPVGSREIALNVSRTSDIMSLLCNQFLPLNKERTDRLS